MSTLHVLLQFGASLTEPLSTGQVITLWAVAVLAVGGFFFFLHRTDKLIGGKGTTVTQEVVKTPVVDDEEAHDEEAAAIALAIHLYKSEMHDMESFTITLQKVSRIYSPWSSKIYTLRQHPRY